MIRHISQPWFLELIFCVLDLHFRIAQVEYRGQTRYTSVLRLHCELLIDTFCRVGHRLELKYVLFAHLSPNAYRAGHGHQAQKGKNWELECRADTQNPFGTLHSHPLLYCSTRRTCFPWCSSSADEKQIIDLRNMRMKNFRFGTDLRDQFMDFWKVTLHSFQTLLFICDRFGCKLWLLLTQNHDRDQFQALAHHNLKLLGYSVEIWAGLDRSSK